MQSRICQTRGQHPLNTPASKSKYPPKSCFRVYRISVLSLCLKTEDSNSLMLIGKPLCLIVIHGHVDDELWSCPPRCRRIWLERCGKAICLMIAEQAASSLRFNCQSYVRPPFYIYIYIYTSSICTGPLQSWPAATACGKPKPCGQTPFPLHMPPRCR